MRSQSVLDRSTPSIYEAMDRGTDINLPPPAEVPSQDDSIFVYQSMDNLPRHMTTTLKESSLDVTLKSQ